MMIKGNETEKLGVGCMVHSLAAEKKNISTENSVMVHGKYVHVSMSVCMFACDVCMFHHICYFLCYMNHIIVKYIILMMLR